MTTRTKIEGLPLQAEWTVTAVRTGKTVDNPNGGGSLTAYYVDFVGPVEARDVYWRRKDPAVVDVGGSYYGTISESEHGPRFKKETPNSGGRGGGGGGSTGSAGGRTYKPESQYDPEKVARMGRAHAQGMAVQVLIAQGIDGAADEMLKEEITRWTDWFSADVDAAGRAATGEATGQTQGVPPPQATTRNDEPQYSVKLLEDAAMDPYPAAKLAAFIEDRLNEEQRARAHAGLMDPSSQAATLANLRKAWERAEGEPLPLTQPGGKDDIPF